MALLRPSVPVAAETISVHRLSVRTHLQSWTTSISKCRSVTLLMLRVPDPRGRFGPTLATTCFGASCGPESSRRASPRIFLQLSFTQRVDAWGPCPSAIVAYYFDSAYCDQAVSCVGRVAEPPAVAPKATRASSCWKGELSPPGCRPVRPCPVCPRRPRP